MRVLPGQYYDSEKASNYNYFRDYDPAIGRYVESDPVGLLGGKNTFSYALAQPIVLFDSRGLTPSCVAIYRGPSFSSGQYRENEKRFEWDMENGLGGGGGFEGPGELEGEPGGELCMVLKMRLTIYRVYYLFDEFDLYERRFHMTTWECTDTLACGKPSGPHYYTLPEKDPPEFLGHKKINGEATRDPIRSFDVSIPIGACTPGFDDHRDRER